MCVRDYNEILTSNEKQGGILKAGRLMEDFRCALLHCGLIDLGFSGNKFTWRNGRSGDAFVQERLDRACAIVEWKELFPHSKIPKRFEEKWASHPKCEHIIMESWHGINPTGSPIV